MAEAPKGQVKPKKATVKKVWGNSLPNELAKLKELMEQFSIVYPEANQPEYELISHGAGEETKYILGRKVGDKVEPVPRNDPKCFDDPAKTSAASSSSQAPSSPELHRLLALNAQQNAFQNMIKQELTPKGGVKGKGQHILISVITKNRKKIDLDNNALLFLKSKMDIRGLATMTYDGEDVDFDIHRIIRDIQQGVKVIDLNQKASSAAVISRAVLFTLVSPKGKRIVFDNQEYQKLQKRADGKGIAKWAYEGEIFDINVIEVKKAVESGRKVMEIRLPKPPKKPLDVAAMNSITKQLDDAIDKNKSMLKPKSQRK